MHICIDFSKMILQFKSWPETIMYGTSVFRLPSSNPFVEDYWPPGKVADNQNK